MKNMNKKQVAYVMAMIVISVVLVIMIKNSMDVKEQLPEVINADIDTTDETDTEVSVPKINVTDIKTGDHKAEKEQIEETQQAKPQIPPKPEPPEQQVDVDKDHTHSHVEENTANGEEIEENHAVEEGDTEVIPEQPQYEKTPTVTETKPQNSVEITDNEEASGEDSNLVPDSENPFLQPPKERDSGLDGGSKSSDFGDGEWGTGDKF